MKLLLLANVFSLAQVGFGEVNLSVATFEKFTTDFTLSKVSGSGNQLGKIELDDFSVSGKVGFNADWKQARFKASMNADAAFNNSVVNSTSLLRLEGLIDFSDWYVWLTGKVLSDVCYTNSLKEFVLNSAEITSYMSEQNRSKAVYWANYMINKWWLIESEYDEVVLTVGYYNRFAGMHQPWTTWYYNRIAGMHQPWDFEGYVIVIRLKADDFTPHSVSLTNWNPTKPNFIMNFSNWRKPDPAGWGYPECSPDAVELMDFVQNHPVSHEVIKMLAGLGNDNSYFSTMATILVVAGVAGAVVVMRVSKLSMKKNKGYLLLDEQ